MTIFEYLKTFFLLLILIAITPPIVRGTISQFQNYSSPKSQVGVICLKGALYDSAPHTKQLTTYFKDKNIKAIMLRMECTGSASGTGETIFNEIMELKKEYPKPIITLVENVCASGGYWIASATDHIIAPSTALVGSIGVAMPYLFQLPEFLAEHKIGYTPLKAGAYKTATDPFVGMTDADKAMLQTALDDSYQQFIIAIAHSRKLNLNNASQWADGRLFNGHQAHLLGLIDEIGSMQNAIRILKEKALIEGEIEWVTPTVLTTWWDFFSGSSSESLSESMTNVMCSQIEKRYGMARTF
jgi:protease-4